MKALTKVSYQYKYTDVAAREYCHLQQSFAAKALTEHPVNQRPIKRVMTRTPTVKLIGQDYYSSSNSSDARKQPKKVNHDNAE